MQKKKKKIVACLLRHLKHESFSTLPRPPTSAQGPIKAENLLERPFSVSTIGGQHGANVEY